ncbi:MAG: hypothetical protein D6694_05955, partial [Gammaproteobacteria bacterium]
FTHEELSRTAAFVGVVSSVTPVTRLLGKGYKRVRKLIKRLVRREEAVEKTAKIRGRGTKGTSFQKAVRQLSEIGQQNVRTLRRWAKSKGWVRKPGDGPEIWGVRDADGNFSWRLKIKPEASNRHGLQPGSNQPRFDARLDTNGTYVNPFTGQIGTKAIGTHQPLEKVYY